MGRKCNYRVKGPLTGQIQLLTNISSYYHDEAMVFSVSTDNILELFMVALRIVSRFFPQFSTTPNSFSSSNRYYFFEPERTWNSKTIICKNNII